MFDSAPPEERSAWIQLVLAVVGYPVYLVLLFADGVGRPLAERAFVWPMIWVVGVSIAVSMILHAVFRVYTDRDAEKPDERDLLITRWGERIGHAFVVLGAVVALVLVMLDAASFWIANAIFVGFFLSAALSSLARLFAYRKGFDPRW